MDSDLATLSTRLGAALGVRGWLLATAESCTGGWIAEAITATAGSSAWFDRGFITYSNAAKIDLLGVSPATLATHGAVSAPTVHEMVLGALIHSRAHIAVAVSGIAGPGGGSAEKPVGTVCLGWGQHGETPRVETCHFVGDREAVRRQSVVAALTRLIELAVRDQGSDVRDQI
ncbi:MAG: nicotinamide-nucleotide amidohydrolase family protein [Azoarcus sp.]|jgi:nicotinamide-nucleotide amidase|nr:nicotinamide-nucleotide amidohydrolase family protein [Azoarcus sp.]